MRFLTGLFEFFVTVLVTVLVIFVSYKTFNKANPDFDQEEEIKKGNVAVAILLTAIMAGSASILHKGLFPILTLLRLQLRAPAQQPLPEGQLVLLALAHFLMVFALVVATISFSLRFFGKLTTNMREGQELARGNVAVGILLAGVVLIVSMYVGDGIESLAKGLLPQPMIGKIQIVK